MEIYPLGPTKQLQITLWQGPARRAKIPLSYHPPTRLGQATKETLYRVVVARKGPSYAFSPWEAPDHKLLHLRLYLANNFHR